MKSHVHYDYASTDLNNRSVPGLPNVVCEAKVHTNRSNVWFRLTSIEGNQAKVDIVAAPRTSCVSDDEGRRDRHMRSGGDSESMNNASASDGKD